MENKKKKRVNRRYAPSGTMAFRIKEERQNRGLEQRDIVDTLKREHGIEISVAGYSKYETGATTTPPQPVMAALSKIFDVSVDYLTTGMDKEPSLEPFNSEEANEIGKIVDSLTPELKQLLLQTARTVEKIVQEQRAKNEAIARILEEDVDLLQEHHRKIASEYIGRTLHHNR